MTCTHIPVSSLGFLEPRIVAAIAEPSKRKRQSAFRQVERILRQLGVLSEDIFGMGLGMDCQGDPILILSHSSPANRLTTGAPS